MVRPQTRAGWGTDQIGQTGGMVSIPLQRLDPDLPVPAYAKPGDAGADLIAAEDVTLPPGGGRALVPTGVAIAIPEGYAGFVQPRSGLALKHGVTCLNTPGSHRLRLPGRTQGVARQHRPHRVLSCDQG